MTDANFEKIAGLIEQTNILLSAIAKNQMRNSIAGVSRDVKKKKLYELTDGSRTIRDLSKTLGLSLGTISRIWQGWEDEGLVVKEKGVYRRVFP